jgi:hypothetical protein
LESIHMEPSLTPMRTMNQGLLTRLSEVEIPAGWQECQTDISGHLPPAMDLWPCRPPPPSSTMTEKRA